MINPVKHLVLLLLVLVGPACADWAQPTYFLLDQPLDYVTIRQKNDGYVLTYRASDNKWIAAVSSGGSTSDASPVTKGITRLSFPPVSASIPIAQSANDPTNNPTVTAANAGNIPVVASGGGSMTHIDPPAGTDTFLASLGTAVPGAFRAIVAGDIDELIALTDLTGVSATTGSGTTVPLATSPTLTTPILTNPTVTNTGTATTVWHGSSAGATSFSAVVSADIQNGTIDPVDVVGSTGTGTSFVLQQSPSIAGTLSLVTSGGASASTLAATANTLTLDVNGAAGALVMTAGDILKTDKIQSTSAGTINLDETSGLTIRDDSGGNGTTLTSVLSTTTEFTINPSSLGLVTIASGDRLKTDTLMSTGGTTVTIAESGGVEFVTDTFTASSTIVPSSTVLTVNVDGTGFFRLASGDTMQSDTFTSLAGGALRMWESSGIEFINDGLSASTLSSFAPSNSGSDAILTFTGASSASLVIGTGERLKFTGQSGLPGTFDAGSETYDTSGGSHIFAESSGNVTVSGCSAPPLTAVSTVTGQTSFTDIGPQMTTTANGLKLGTTFHSPMRGTFSTNSTDTIEWQLLYNATVIASFAAASPGTGISNELIEILTDCTVRSTGATGTVAVTAKLHYRTGATLSIQRNVTAQPVTIDTTAAGTWKWQVKHGSSNASNTQSFQTGYWQKVN